MSFSSPRVLATGINPPGTGNLSSYAALALRQANCDVTVLCRSPEKAERLIGEGFRAQTVNFQDVGSLAREIRKLGTFDAVLNNIGEMGTKRILGGHRAALKESNATVPANIMRALVESGRVPLSSAHVGSLMEMPYKAATEVRGQRVTLTAEDLKNPNLSSYGYYKAEGSKAWEDGYHEVYPELDPLIMHMGMIFGPRDPAAKEMVEGLQMGVYPRLSYDGDPTVPLIGADEAANYAVHMMLANLDGKKGGRYFVANPNLGRARASQVLDAGEAEFHKRANTLDFLRLIGVPLPHVILAAGVLRDSALTLFTGKSTMLDWSRVRELINQSPYFMINMDANTLATFEGLGEIPVRQSIQEYLHWYVQENPTK